jgi:pyruvate kinase
MSTDAALSAVRHTRIVATIGPVSRDPEVLKQLITAGVDVCRINCSHASAEAIRGDVARIRRTAMACGKNVAVLLDLQGPKIRTGKVQKPLPLEKGDVLRVVMDSALVGTGEPEPGRVFVVGTTWTRMSLDVQPGEPVLFADGALLGQVVAVRQGGAGPDEVDIRIDVGGALGSNKGINMPETKIQAPALTEKDLHDVAVGVEAGADYVALSFARSADDVNMLRAELQRLGAGDVPIVAKIEKPQGVANIDEILLVVQGIMVARGDLGVEIPFEQVPGVQKMLIEKANKAGVLVITATQMLDSMERNPRPTRAEITDVANAILDGTDAVMLSGETASGNWPIEAVQVMDRIARQVEGSEWFRLPPLHHLPASSVAEGTVLRAACYAVREVAAPMVVFTWSGATAIKASKSRPRHGVFAITHNHQVADRLALAWGVRAVTLPVIEGTDELIAAGEKALIDAGFVQPGAEVVLLAGRAPMRGATNMMKVEVVDGRFHR